MFRPKLGGLWQLQVLPHAVSRSPPTVSRSPTSNFKMEIPRSSSSVPDEAPYPTPSKDFCSTQTPGGVSQSATAEPWRKSGGLPTWWGNPGPDLGVLGSFIVPHSTLLQSPGETVAEAVELGPPRTPQLPSLSLSCTLLSASCVPAGIHQDPQKRSHC